MNLWGTFRIALRALSRNKLRSILTMLGIIIGVAAVIAVVGIGQGASASIQAQISQLGNNMLYVMAGSANQGGMRGRAGSPPTPSPQDADGTQRQSPAVRAVS